MRKQSAAIFTLLLAGILMTGCGNNTDGKGTDTATGEPEVTTEISDNGENTNGEKPENRDGMKGAGEKESMGNRFGMGTKGDGNPVTETDPEIVSLIEENSGKFQQFTYEDSETGISLEYSLYIPENYSDKTSYPMMMYIPDASGASKSAKEIVEQYYGANVWVTDEDQKKHPSFVLVPAFSVIVVDDNYQVSDEVTAAKNLIDYLTKEYSIDKKRLYTTGQSMGCMTSLYLNGKYPDLFAASLFVSGQWDISALSPLKEAKFFYITSAGDEKASGGQQEVQQMLENAGVTVSFDTWSAQNTADEQNTSANTLIEKGASANMIQFEKGTCFTNGETGMEHNASFVYGYKIPAVRDWIYEQSK